MPEWLKNILGGFNLGSIGQLASSIFSSVANVKMQRETNATNMQIAREQNAAAAAESEKAYERSKATNQVRLMQDAGMSKAGALNAINGGGSYQPAPVNAGQAQAPQIDLTHAFDGMITAAENNKQRILQEKLAKMQIKATEDAQKAQFEENEKQRKHDALMKDVDTANQTQHDYIEYEKHKERLALDRDRYQLDLANARQNWRIIDRQVEYLKKQTKSIDVQITGYQLDNIRKQLENDNYPTLAKLANEKAQQEINAMILAYNQAVENHELDKQAKELQLRWERLTQDLRINAENARNELSAFMDYGHLQMNSELGNMLGALEILVNNYLPALARLK